MTIIVLNIVRQRVVDSKNKGKKELIRRVAEGSSTVKDAALLLGMSERAVRHLKKKYVEQGESALIHGNSGRQPMNYIGKDIRARIAALKKSDAYCKVSVARFRELLAEREKIKISYTALSGILKAAGIVSKKKAKEETEAFRFKGSFGETLGVAAHSHDWFGDGTSCVLHGLTDDATRRITGLYFCRDECLKGYIEVLRQTVQSYGIPLGLYSEKAGTLLSGDSQLGFIVENRLGIEIIGDADAPYAKKHVEYLRNVLQNHLPRWLKKQGITGMDKANFEMCRFITLFNDRFAREPRIPESSFVPLGDHDLDLMLAVRYETATDNRGRFFYNEFIFTVDSAELLANKKIIFVFSEETGFLAYCEDKYHQVSLHGSKNKDRVVRPSHVLKIIVQESYYAVLDDLRERKK